MADFIAEEEFAEGHCVAQSVILHDHADVWAA